MRIERLFSSVPLRPTAGAYDAGDQNAISGALSALRSVDAARRRSAAGIAAAHEDRTRVLLEQASTERTFGKAVTGLGASLASLIVEADRRQAAQRQYTEIENRSLALAAGRSQARELARRDTAPDGRGLDRQYTQLAMESARRAINVIADPDAQRVVESRFHRDLAAERADVRLEEVRTFDAFSRQQLSRRIGIRAAQAVEHDDARRETWELQAIAADIHAAVDLGIIPAKEGSLHFKTAREFVLRKKLEALSRNDPAKALFLLSQGAYEHLIAHDGERDGIRQFLSEAKAALASDAVRLAALDLRISDDVQTRRAGEGSDDTLSQDLDAGGTPGQRHAHRENVKLLEHEARARQKIAFLPWRETKALLTANGSADSLRARAVRRAYLRDAGDWVVDPAAMASRHPAGATIQGRMAVQLAKGIPAPSVYTREEAAQLVSAYVSAPLEQRLELSGRVKKQAGGHLNAALRDLSAAGLPASGRLFLLMDRNPPPARLVERLDTVERSTLSDLRFDGSAERLAEIDALLPDALAPYLDSFSPALEGRGLDDLKPDFYSLTRKLALVEAHAGHSAPEATARAVADLFGRNYVLVDNMRVPRRHDPGIVAAHAAQLRERALQHFTPDPEATGVVLAAGEDVEAWRQRVAAEGDFATTPDERGAVLLTAEGLPVRDTGGRVFGFAFDEAEPVVGDGDGPDAQGPAYDDLHRRLLWSMQAGPAAAPYAANAGRPPVRLVAGDGDGSALDRAGLTQLHRDVLDLSGQPGKLDDVLKRIFEAYGEAGLSAWSSMPRVAHYAKKLARGADLSRQQRERLSEFLSPEYIAEQRRLIPTLDRNVAAARGRAMPARGRDQSVERREVHREARPAARPRREWDQFRLGTRDPLWAEYRRRKQMGVPAGFGSPQEVTRVREGMLQVVKGAGIDPGRVTIAVRGSAATGYRFDKASGFYTDERFDAGGRDSDLDFAIAGKEIAAHAKAAGVPFSGDHTLPLTDDQLEDIGLSGLVPPTVNGKSRGKTSIVIFKSTRELRQRAHIVLDAASGLRDSAPGGSIERDGKEE